MNNNIWNILLKRFINYVSFTKNNNSNKLNVEL